MTKNKITEGNSFALNIRQAVWRTLGGVIQPLLASELVDVHLYVGSGTSKSTATEYNVTADGDTISAVMPATLKRGVYRTWMTAIYQGREVASACECAFEIVAFDEHGIYAPERIDGQPCVYLQGASMTDPEIEQYKARLLELQQQREQEVQALEEQKQKLSDAIASFEGGFATDEQMQVAIAALKAVLDSEAENAKKTDLEFLAAKDDTILEEVQNKLTPIEAVLVELSNGKREMVNALALKSVQSSTDKTLSAIADDVRSIAQATITIDGGEMYEKQLFGAPTDKTNAYEQPDTPMWNLYQVMANLLSDGRFVNHGGIVLAEYPKEDKTIVLQGVGAGGAYLTSDGAMYEADIEHTWNDDLDGHVNRWVAYILKNQGVDYNIINAKTLSLYIGRSIGTLICTISTNLKEINVFEGGSIKATNIQEVQKWDRGIIHANPNIIGTLFKIDGSNSLTNVVVDIEGAFTTGIIVASTGSNTTLKSISLPKVTSFEGGCFFNQRPYKGNLCGLATLQCDNLVEIKSGYLDVYDWKEATNLVNYIFPKLKRVTRDSLKISNKAPVQLIVVGPMETNLNLTDWISRGYVLQMVDISLINENIRKYIAARVADGGGTLTVTFSGYLYENLEQETIDAFVAKNWLVANSGIKYE